MKYCACKDINREVKARVRDGWIFERRRKHGRLVSPSGRMVCVPFTPSDRRALYNFRREVIRAAKSQTHRQVT